MEQRLSIITLGVRDLETSRAFYDSLGWKVATEQFDGIAFYNLNGFVLALYPLDKLAEETGDTETPTGSKFTLACNVASKEEVDNILAEIEAQGGIIAAPAQDRFWGGYSGYFQDPDGHYWEVAFNPFTLPAEDGTYKIEPPPEQ